MQFEAKESQAFGERKPTDVKPELAPGSPSLTHRSIVNMENMKFTSSGFGKEEPGIVPLAICCVILIPLHTQPLGAQGPGQFLLWPFRSNRPAKIGARYSWLLSQGLKVLLFWWETPFFPF